MSSRWSGLLDGLVCLVRGLLCVMLCVLFARAHAQYPRFSFFAQEALSFPPFPPRYPLPAWQSLCQPNPNPNHLFLWLEAARASPVNSFTYEL